MAGIPSRDSRSGLGALCLLLTLAAVAGDAAEGLGAGEGVLPAPPPPSCPAGCALDRAAWRRHCGRMDCPDYSVCCRNKHRGYEVREYAHALWAVTTVQANNFGTAMEVGAMRLAAYFHGANNASAEMELTLPLLVTHRPHPQPHPFEARPYQVALFLPHKYQAHAPVPASPNVYLVFYNPKPHIFAHAFSHLASDKWIIHEARHLWAALDHAGVDYMRGEVMVASFNCPWNRGRKKRHARRWHTEIWLHGNFSDAASVPNINT